MTENQEKELFNTLGKLVAGVKQIQQTQGEHTATLNEHSAKLNEHSAKLNEHSAMLTEHSAMLTEHSAMLKAIDSKVDTIAMQVLENDKRLTARVSSVENRLENIEGRTH